MKLTNIVFLVVAVAFASQPATAQRARLAHAWEFQPQQCSPSPQNLRRQLMCSDPELRVADLALSNAYREKIAQLGPAQIDALRSDSRHWWSFMCVGEDPRNAPLAPEAARACLERELAERRQLVLALPAHRQNPTYLFTRTELGLLRTYPRRTRGLISGIDTIHNALRIGLRRVFAAVLAKPEPRYENAATVDEFLNVIVVDTAMIEDGHYLVDFGDNSSHTMWGEGLFVVDLETGETALAFIDDEMPQLEIWRKECSSPPFERESDTLFQKYASQIVVGAKGADALFNGRVSSQWVSTPCN